MIDLPIREKVCQCRYCGAVRLDGKWVKKDVLADVVGTCSTCGAYEQKRAQLKRERAARDLERRAAKRQLRGAVADPFAAFREET